MKQQLEALLDGLCRAYVMGDNLIQLGSPSLARKAMTARLSYLNLSLIERTLPSIHTTIDNEVATKRIMAFIDECVEATEDQLDALDIEVQTHEMVYA